MNRVDELFQKILGLINAQLLAPTEEASERNGYLSYRAEWHAAAWGFATGAIYAITGDETVLIMGVGWVFTTAGDGDVPGYLPYPTQFLNESLYMIAHCVAAIPITTVAMQVV